MYARNKGIIYQTMLLFPDNFITMCFYNMIINMLAWSTKDIFVPSDDAGVALTKNLSIDRPIHENKNINCEPVT